MDDKIKQLFVIYDDFEKNAAPYRSEAACRKGCSFCCSDAGSIDITTLEGLMIRNRINRFQRPRQVAVKKALAADMKRKEQNKPSPCPFLMKNNVCMIYDCRPFACRRLYSLAICSSGQHPIVSKKVMDMGEESIRTLQRLDDTGYSGHISYILYMLDASAFLTTYLNGDYRPEEVVAFGKSHGIAINQMVALPT